MQTDRQTLSRELPVSVSARRSTSRWLTASIATLSLFLLTSLGAADGLSLAQRLATLTVASSVAFEETHQNAFFKQPQISSGVLSFDDEFTVLTKSVERPDPMQLTVSADQVSISENGETKTIQLAATTYATQIFGALRALLRADLGTIEQYFEIQYSAEGSLKWSLQLLPLSGELKAEVESIDMTVIDNRIVSIRTAFNNGDWQQLRLQPALAVDGQSSDTNEGK